MIDVDRIVNFDEASERANDKSTARFVVNLGNLLLTCRLEPQKVGWTPGVRPHPPETLDYLKFKLWVKDEGENFTFVLLLALSPDAHNKV